MENVMTNGFAELSAVEMETVAGGGWYEFGGVLVGTLAIAGAPIAACFCPPAGAGMLLGGAGIIGKVTGAY